MEEFRPSKGSAIWTRLILGLVAAAAFITAWFLFAVSEDLPHATFLAVGFCVFGSAFLVTTITDFLQRKRIRVTIHGDTVTVCGYSGSERAKVSQIIRIDQGPESIVLVTAEKRIVIDDSFWGSLSEKQRFLANLA